MWHLEAALHPHAALNHAVAAANLLPSSSAAASSFLQPPPEPDEPAAGAAAAAAGASSFGPPGVAGPGSRALGSALNSSSIVIRQRQLQSAPPPAAAPMLQLSAESSAAAPHGTVGAADSTQAAVPSYYPSRYPQSNTIPAPAAPAEASGGSRLALGTSAAASNSTSSTSQGVRVQSISMDEALLQERRASSAAAGPSAAPLATSSSAASSAAAGGPGGAIAAVPFCNVAQALSNLLTAAHNIALQMGILFLVDHPLYVVPSSPKSRRRAPSLKSKPLAGPAAAGAASAPRDGAATGEELLPRPSRPIHAAVEPSMVKRVMAYVVDIALQCTPKGGQVAVSARPAEGGVQIAVAHTGRMIAERLHSRALAVAVPLRGSAGVGAARAGWPAAGRPAAAAAAAAGSGMLSSLQAGPGTGLVSLELAQALIQQAGGRISIVYPGKVLNAATGILDVGTSVEIWLPGP